ncbi:SDR family oxidoreductase [Formosa haliotis]|uniref:SDR family oxidoreductase n=1 Tax=Formosa haliotis TaxID=1555194 RepID=UPI0008243504|nr:SDR family oxidoreductase [Formosa haliotis]
MEKILVVGATGTTGHKIVELLKSSELFEPIAMVRNEAQESEFKTKNIKTVFGDLEQDVSKTVTGADKVIFAAGSGGKKVEAVDRDGAIKMIKASEDANIKKFVMLSSMGADKPEQSERLQDYLTAKQKADQYLTSSHLNYTIVRPGRLNNHPGQGHIQLGKSLSNSGEISRDDVAKTLVYALDNEQSNTSTFEILEGDTAIPEAFKSMS